MAKTAKTLDGTERDHRRSPETDSTVEAANAPLILVVDDFSDAREMYAEYLKFTGFRVAEAADGRDALEKTFDLRPDLILMDLSLPNMDGWEATRRLKADARTARIPVIALTGHALAGHAEGAREAGCDGFIAKPCFPDVLVDEIRGHLARSGRRPRAGGTSSSGRGREAHARGATAGVRAERPRR